MSHDFEFWNHEEVPGHLIIKAVKALYNESNSWYIHFALVYFNQLDFSDTNSEEWKRGTEKEVGICGDAPQIVLNEPGQIIISRTSKIIHDI